MQSRSTRKAAADARKDADYLYVLEREFGIAKLEQSHEAIAGLKADGTIAYLNPEWMDFASELGGHLLIDARWGIGSHYVSAVAEPLRPFLEKLLDAAPVANSTALPMPFHYESSTAHIFREFTLQVLALPQHQGWLLCHGLSTEMPHDLVSHRPCAADSAVYRDEFGHILQCAHCRRIRHPLASNRWDWVPAWLEHPADDLCPDLCEACHDRLGHNLVVREAQLRRA